jgi:RNA polymerase sigma-70 factor (ECF subfamily)
VAEDSPELTDAGVSACLEQVRQGDEAASRTLIRYMYPLVLKIVRSNRPRRGDEEDLVQTVMAKVFKSLGQFAGVVPFRHWVSRIAVNTCMNAFRYETRRPELRMADLSEEEASVVQNLNATDEKLDAGLGLAARDLVQHLVACLAPKDRMLVRLLYLEGFSVDEASAATGWSRGAIQMRISRAKLRMRTAHAHLLEGNNL